MFSLFIIYILTNLLIQKFYFYLYIIFNKSIFIKNQLNSLYLYIRYNKNEYKYLNYYKILSKLNIKQYLIGSGIVLFFLLIYFFINLYLQLHPQIYLTFNCNDIYDNFYINKNNLNIKIYFFEFIYYYIIFYILIHIIFGFYNIFYDYLKDSAFILFINTIFLIYIILFSILSNPYIIYITIFHFKILLKFF